MKIDVSFLTIKGLLYPIKNKIYIYKGTVGFEPTKDIPADFKTTAFVHSATYPNSNKKNRTVGGSNPRPLARQANTLPLS